MKRLLSLASIAVPALLAMPVAAQEAPLNIAFTIHSSASNTFWQAVKKGFDDGCGKIGAKCQMIFTQNEGSIEQQVRSEEHTSELQVPNAQLVCRLLLAK